jgi:hypothetical protein
MLVRIFGECAMERERTDWREQSTEKTDEFQRVRGLRSLLTAAPPIL